MKPNLEQKLAFRDVLVLQCYKAADYKRLKIFHGLCDAANGRKMEVWHFSTPGSHLTNPFWWHCTVCCSWFCQQITSNLQTPIRTGSQAHYSGQLANGLGALRHYSRLIWFQSDDGAMSTQAACHSGELTQKDKGGGQVQDPLSFEYALCSPSEEMFCSFYQNEASIWHNLAAQQALELKWQKVMFLAAAMNTHR